jgi:hypothetical protein
MVPEGGALPTPTDSNMRHTASAFWILGTQSRGWWNICLVGRWSLNRSRFAATRVTKPTNLPDPSNGRAGPIASQRSLTVGMTAVWMVDRRQRIISKSRPMTGLPTSSGEIDFLTAGRSWSLKLAESICLAKRPFSFDDGACCAKLGLTY